MFFSFIRIFFNLLNFFPVTRFLVTPLLVTRYCVTLFSNTPRHGLTMLFLLDEDDTVEKFVIGESSSDDRS